MWACGRWNYYIFLNLILSIKECQLLACLLLSTFLLLSTCYILQFLNLLRFHAFTFQFLLFSHFFSDGRTFVYKYVANGTPFYLLYFHLPTMLLVPLLTSINVCFFFFWFFLLLFCSCSSSTLMLIIEFWLICILSGYVSFIHFYLLLIFLKLRIFHHFSADAICFVVVVDFCIFLFVLSS